MTKKEIAAKLREALALMNDDGTHWAIGEFVEPIAYTDEDGYGEPVDFAYCSLGAIRHVTQTPVEDPSEVSNEVALALAKVLPPSQRPIHGDDELEEVFTKIVDWNDARGRTWDEVVERFNEAAALAEQAEE